jgi:hypothetical protein
MAIYSVVGVLYFICGITSLSISETDVGWYFLILMHLNFIQGAVESNENRN